MTLQLYSSGLGAGLVGIHHWARKDQKKNQEEEEEPAPF